MELKIFWTNFATIELKNIYNYYKKTTSISITKKIVKEITCSTLILLQNFIAPPIYMLYTFMTN